MEQSVSANLHLEKPRHCRTPVFAIILCLFASLMVLAPSEAQAAPTHYIEMSDGVKLAAFIEIPNNDMSQPWPTIVTMDGYAGGDMSATGPRGNVPKEMRANYALVRVSLRGTGCSGGEFHLFDQRSAQDGYEVIEWIARQPWSNSDVGYWGHSYGGLTGIFVAATNPPHLRATSVSGVFDDSYRSIAMPGGIPNIGFAALWPAYVRWYQSDQQASRNGISREGIGGQCAQNVATREPSPYDPLRPHDPLALEFYSQLAVGRLDSPFWREHSPITYAKGIKAPIHITQAWHDEQTGPTGPHIFEEITPEVPKRLLVTNGDHNEAGIRPNTIADRVRWMERWVRGVENGIDHEPPVRALLEVRNDSTIGGEIQGDEFPLRETDWQRWYLRPEQTLSRRAPSSTTEQPDSYISGSRRQSWDYSRWNYTGTRPPVEQHTDSITQPEGPDEFSYRTRRFEEPTTLLGPMAATLYVSTTAPDTDFFVEISDVFPDGRRQRLQRGLLRGSHRALDVEKSDKTAVGDIFRPHHTFTDPQPVVPGEITEYMIRIFEVGHVFRPGHRLEIKIHTPPAREQLWSYEPSSFPGINTIHHDAAHPSSILLPFAPAPADLLASSPACTQLVGIRCVDGSSSLGGGPGGGGGDYEDPRQPTSAAFTDDSARSATYSDDATIAAQLVDDTGKPIEEGELVFSLRGEDVVDRWTATTGSDGIASSIRRIDARPGAYTLTVDYDGEEGAYEASRSEIPFQVDKELTTTRLAVSGQGSNRTVTATLTEDDEPPIAEREIIFYADGTEIGRATTDANGVAFLEVPPRHRGDRVVFEAHFLGDDFYAPSTHSGSPPPPQPSEGSGRSILQVVQNWLIF